MSSYPERGDTFTFGDRTRDYLPVHGNARDLLATAWVSEGSHPVKVSIPTRKRRGTTERQLRSWNVQ
jgi:hypothetical protein